jgi:hypothetical protein
MTDTFGNNPVTVGTPVGTPVGTAYVPNTANGDLTPIEGIAINTDSGSPPRKSTAIRLGLKDGDNVTQGLIADPAVVGDNPGTVSSKLRGLTKIFNDVWDSVNHRLHVNVDNAVALGQATSVNSSPVVPASDHPTSQVASSDGLIQTKVGEQALWLYGSGGPVDTTGKPQQLSGDRLKSWQGKNPGTGTITTTVSGDANLVFSVAPKTIMPGQGIVLSGAATPEVVYVATSYVPSNTATTIPLQTTVVSAGQTTAKWDQFHPYGGNAAAGLTHFGVLPAIMMMQDAASGANGLSVVTNAAGDGAAKASTLFAQSGLFNGSFVDRARSNMDVVLLASAARTTTQTSADQVNYNARGIKVWLDVTVPGTGSVTLTINEKDPGSGKYLLLLSGIAVTTAITSRYVIYPGFTAAANVSLNDFLPRTFQIVVTANNANSITYSVGYSLIY